MSVNPTLARVLYKQAKTLRDFVLQLFKVFLQYSTFWPFGFNSLFKNHHCIELYLRKVSKNRKKLNKLHIVTVFEELVLQKTDYRIYKFYTSSPLFYSLQSRLWHGGIWLLWYLICSCQVHLNPKNVSLLNKSLYYPEYAFEKIF